MQYEVRFYLGSTSQRPNELPYVGCWLAQDLLASTYGGYTLTESVGGWRDPKGELITERSWVLEAVTDDTRRVNEIAANLRDWYGQSAVLVTVKPLTSAEFV